MAKAGAQTKERIIDTAIALFNERGTKVVSTNHIAAAMEISPWQPLLPFPQEGGDHPRHLRPDASGGMEEYLAINDERGPGTTATMEGTFLMIQRFNWRYRFFKRELSSLVMDDPELKASFIDSHLDPPLGVVRNAIDQAVRQGFLRNIPSEERELLAEQVWLVSLFWLNYLEVGGEEVTEETLCGETTC